MLTGGTVRTDRVLLVTLLQLVYTISLCNGRVAYVCLSSGYGLWMRLPPGTPSVSKPGASKDVQRSMGEQYAKFIFIVIRSQSLTLAVAIECALLFPRR